jgi:hypothetical protein
MDRAQKVALKTIQDALEIKKLGLTPQAEGMAILASFLNNFENTPPPFEKGGFKPQPNTKK